MMMKYLAIFTILMVCILKLSAAQEAIEAPVLAAILQDNDELLREVLKNGANPNENVAGWSPLHAASSKGNAAWVSLLLNKGGNVNVRNNDNRTPLFEAIGEGQLEVAEILLENGADPNIQDSNGDTCLHVASIASFAAVKLLLSNKADPNVVNKNGAPALFYAAAFGKEEIVKYLLSHGANALMTTENKLTSLHEAAISGNVEVISALLTAGCKVNAVSTEGWSALHNAVQFNRFAAAKLLLEKGANVNQRHASDRTPLFVAALNSTSEMVSLLLRHGADPSIHDNTNTFPIHIAAFRGEDEMIKELLKEGGNVNARDAEGSTPLHKAVFSHHTSTVKLLLSKKASPDLGTFEKRWTPLMIAVAVGDLEIVTTLVENGADLRIASFDRTTPLQIAATAGHAAVVDYLAKKGANLDVFDSKGWTPLHNAIQANQLEVVKVLLKYVDPNKTHNGVLPVTLAGIAGRNEIVEVLLTGKNVHHADPNVADPEGWTPLLHLTGIGNEEAVEMLLNAGADVHHKTNDGYSVIEIAQINNKLNVIGALARHGANLKNLDVAKWLRYHEFESLVELFTTNQITGDVLPELTKSILKEELGITKIGTLVLLNKALATLRVPQHHVHDEL